MTYFDLTDFTAFETDCIYTTVFKQKQQKSEAFFGTDENEKVLDGDFGYLRSLVFPALEILGLKHEGFKTG